MDAVTKCPLPEAFVQRVREQLGGELPSFLEAMEALPVRGLRMNPFRNHGGIPFRDTEDRIPWTENGWELEFESCAGTTVAHEAGAFYLQEPAAMLPAAVMDAKPGEIILDLCAAPGGKTTQIALGMRGKGLLISNDPVPNRAAVLSRNIERMGIPNTVVTCAYPENLAKKWPECFDGVMVDAPCSGEGMFRRHPETRAEWSPEKAAGCSLRQQEILTSAAGMVRPGGRLIYSTCTWNPAENEVLLMSFLNNHPEFRIEPFNLPGINAPDGYYTCWPHRLRGEGQFTACLHKYGTDEKAVFPVDRNGFRPDSLALRIWKESGIGTETPNLLFGNILAWLPFIPELSGIRIFRMGLHIGQVRGKNFFPDHAAAVGIHRPDMPETRLTDQEALAYLSGETIRGNISGWTLMTWRDLVLGWGKGSEGIVKNHYPKGLRNGKLIV